MTLFEDLNKAVAAGAVCRKNLIELKRILREESSREEDQTLFLAELDLVEKNLRAMLTILGKHWDKKIRKIVPIDPPRPKKNIYDETERILDSFYDRLNIIVIDLEIKKDNFKHPNYRRINESMFITMLQSGNANQIAYLLEEVENLRKISKLL